MSQPRGQNESSSRQESAESAPLWSLIPLADFKAPSGAAPEVVRSGLHDLWRRLRGDGLHMDGEQAEAQAEMERPSTQLLDWAAPEPDWATEDPTGPVRDLGGWLEQETPSAGVQTLVDTPIPLLHDRLTHWADQQGYAIIQPPPPETILNTDRGWIDGLPLDSGQRFLLPCLERCFLRHHNGLDLLRRLIERIDRFRPALLVVCNSWAWRYLCQVEKIDDVLGAPLVSAPFGDDLLNRWLSRSAHKASPVELVFREASSGKAVLDTIDLERTVESNSSTFLKNLAARSRGNPRVAWEIWRRSLLTTKDSTVGKDAQDAAKNDEGFTLWVRPWDQVQLPDLTGGANHADGMVLQSILLHGQLSQGILAELLPFAPSQTLSTLHRLRSGGFLQRDGTQGDETRGDESMWKPAPTGYPAIHRFLTNEGFLVDQL